MNQFFKQKKSFTLIELLIVIGILAILTAAVVIVLNPTELLKQGRDSTRMTDLASLSKTIQLLLTQNPSLSLGTASTVYISLPDTSSTCTNLSLPTLPAGYTYHCVPTASSTLLNSSGWLPIDFTSSIQSLPRLPIDPTNTSSTGLYYTYTPNPATQTYELTSIVESIKYRLGGSADTVSTDGGSTSYLYEQGTNLSLSPITDSGLVGYWTFDEGSGTQALDASGNNNTGTWQGTLGSQWTTGKIGGAGSFNGSDNYIDAGVGNSLNMGIGDFSLSIWINGDTSASYVQLLSKANNIWQLVPANKGYEIFLQNRRYDLNISDGTNGNTNNQNLANSTLLSNVWYNITIVYSHGVGWTYYLNGTVDGIVSKTNIGNIDSSFSLQFNTRGITKFSGKIDDTRIYNRALSAAEVLALYNSTK